MILGFWLRIWRVHYGLPTFVFFDELWYVYQSLNIGGGGWDTDLAFSLYCYICFLADAVYIVAAKALGHFHSLKDAWRLYQSDPTVYFIIGRLVNVFFGTLTIPLLYFTAKKVVDHRAALVSAFYLTFCFLAVQTSQIGYKDTGLVFFILYALFFSLRALETDRLRDFMLSGFTAGLAFSAKWSAPPVFFFGPLVVLLRNLKQGKPLATGLWGSSTLLFFAAAVVGFTLGTPAWIWNFPKIVSQLNSAFFIFKPGGVGHLGHDSNTNWLAYLTNILPDGLGLPLEILGLAGAGLILSRRPAVLLFLYFPLVYFAIAGSFVIREFRYMLPLAPFLCVTAAFMSEKIIARWMAKDHPRYGVALLILSLFVISPSLIQTLRYNQLKTIPTTRELAYQWVQNHASVGSRFLRSLYIFKLPKTVNSTELDRSLFLQGKEHSSLKSVQEYRKAGYDYLILDEWHLNLALAPSSRKIHHSDAPARYRQLREDLEKNARLAAVFNPYDNPDLPFDSENVEFEVRSLWKKKRFGPKIWIYQLKDYV